MALSRDTLVKQQKALEQQREQLVDQIRQVVGALQVVEFLITEYDKPEAAPAEQPFPQVGSDSTLHTEADVPQGS